MHHRHCITKKASNFTELSAKYKLYLISSRRNFWKFPTWIHYRQLNLSPLRYTRVVSLGIPSCHLVATKSSLCRCEPLFEYLLQMLVCPQLQAILIIVIEWKQVPRKGKGRKTIRQTIWSNPSWVPAVTRLLTPRARHRCVQTTIWIHPLANLSELNWGINQFEVWTGKAKCNTQLWITKMDKFNAVDMWLGLLHIFG